MKKVILENGNDKIQDDYSDTESDNESYLESEIDDNYQIILVMKRKFVMKITTRNKFIESDNKEIVEDNSKVIEEVKDLGNSFNSDAEEEFFEETTNLNSNTNQKLTMNIKIKILTN